MPTPLSEGWNLKEFEKYEQMKLHFWLLFCNTVFPGLLAI